MNAVEQTKVNIDNKKPFPEMYDDIITKIQLKNVDNTLLEVLRQKRLEGFKKYGAELSFQSSFENAMASPTINHAKEEVLDAINYVAHSLFKDHVLNNGEDLETYTDILQDLDGVYKQLKVLELRLTIKG